MYRCLSILVLAVGAFGLTACSGSDNPLGSGGTGGGTPRLNCDDVPVPPPSCGEPCVSDSECELGTYCDGDCTFQCLDELPCPQGMECNIRGRCAQVFTGTGGTGNSGGGNSCQSIQVTPTRSIPNVMFLVDQSGSMDEKLSGGTPGPGELTRWQIAHNALNAIVGETDSIVRYGLTTYTSRNGSENPPCPRLPTQVDFALANAGSFVDDDNVYPYSYPGSQSEDPTWGGEDTPTGDSIDALVSLVQASPPPSEGPTIIVLATDGLPDSCEFPDPSNSTQRNQAENEAVDAAKRAHDDANIDLFFLWVGPLSDQNVEDHVQRVANAGVGLATNGSEGDATFWVGDNPENLENAFRQIISDSISCDIEIDKPFDDVDKACNEGDVQLNGVPLDCPSEWRVKPGVSNVIELVGSACTSFKNDVSTFTAIFPCGAIVVE